jgi:flagellar M-ring protein FliF
VNGLLAQLSMAGEKLLQLGPRRLAALAAIILTVMAVTGLSGYFLSRPAFETLYAGLDRQDVARISLALKEGGIPFDVTSDDTTVLVQYGMTSQARMMLAEKGLPNGSSAGYELFDKIGALGLTTFMQEVTRVRALEGELARTIQLLKGVRAARVHLVLPDEGSFRRAKQPPSASVIIRAEQINAGTTAMAIRRLVAAAIPGMNIDQVTVVNSDGTLLASGDDPAESAPGKMRALEKTISQEIEEKIRKTLTPYLSAKNFQVSVLARVNGDKKQINETIVNPDSKVERSVRVTRENQTSSNSTQPSSTSVDRNVPQGNSRSNDGRQSNEENQKREELTNYELSSKTISTVTAGYELENLSVAVLVNRPALIAALGSEAKADAVGAQIKEIESLVSSAAGIKKDRGDTLKVAALDFSESAKDLEPVAGPAWSEILMRQAGSMVTALAALGVVALVLTLGVKPVVRSLLPSPGDSDSAMPSFLPSPDMAGITFPTPSFDPDSFVPSPVMTELSLDGGGGSALTDYGTGTKKRIQERLDHIIEADEEQAVAILKQWIREGAVG